MNRTDIHITASVYGLVTPAEQMEIRSVKTMLRISKEIEHAVIRDRARARVFSGFQQMSAFARQAERYQALAQHAESVYVFAHMDMQAPPIAGVQYVPLPEEHQLTKEWFVVADSPGFFTALVTEELPEQKRMFKGMWTFDEEMVTILQEWLSNAVGAAPLAESARDYRNHARLVSAMAARIAGG